MEEKRKQAVCIVAVCICVLYMQHLMQACNLSQVSIGKDTLILVRNLPKLNPNKLE